MRIVLQLDYRICKCEGERGARVSAVSDAVDHAIFVEVACTKCGTSHRVRWSDIEVQVEEP